MHWDSTSASATQPSCNKTVHFDVLMLYRQVSTKEKNSKGKQHKRQYTSSVFQQVMYFIKARQGPQMHQDSAESGFPPTGNPSGSYPDGTVHAGKLIWSKSGWPGQAWTGQIQINAETGTRKFFKKNPNITLQHMTGCDSPLQTPAGLVVRL